MPVLEDYLNTVWLVDFVMYDSCINYLFFNGELEKLWWSTNHKKKHQVVISIQYLSYWILVIINLIIFYYKQCLRQVAIKIIGSNLYLSNKYFANILIEAE